MNVFDQYALPLHRAICYSGFRDGQEPGKQNPSYAEIKEDLLLLQPHWQYLRLYDCDEQARTVLEVIRGEGFSFRVMLGAFIEAEENNPNCPWGGGVYSEAQLEKNRISNERKIQTLAHWANEFPDIIFSVSAGNEACVDWTDHLVPVERVIYFVQQLKQQVKQPVTFCENYVPWQDKLALLAREVDFISLHTYPVWEYKPIEEAIAYTEANYRAVADLYPGKAIVITEAGWATQSSGRGIEPSNVNEQFQQQYFHELMQWSEQHHVLTFFFEAFDENWKGSSHPLEPEKHWGLYYANRKPKLVMTLFSE
ncbi:MAG: glycosyl hydrolase family 17 protein [Bacteroidetes bacterium]|nr:glycosyl hydrolase family 17 protein [Bacteroidota bacterium]